MSGAAPPETLPADRDIVPDFRSPKTGLYNNLKRLNLPYAEAVFDISFFRQQPEPFYVLAKELYPGKFHPTVSHAFIALLAQKGLLQMLFTQNIDCLERSAGVPAEKIVEAHGSFASQHCIECQQEFPDDKMKDHVLEGKVPHCPECGGYVKPDIVFFGESLPKAFERNSYQTTMADLVLVLGTSLTVYPFAGLPEMAKAGAPRVLFNMERVGRMGTRGDDVIHLGRCDDGIRELADELGWRDELEKLWRDVVGQEESERQLRSRKERDEEIEDEVHKLAEEVDEALNFEEESERKPDDHAEEDGIKQGESAGNESAGNESAEAQESTITAHHDELDDKKDQKDLPDTTSKTIGRAEPDAKTTSDALTGKGDEAAPASSAAEVDNNKGTGKSIL